MTASRLTDSQVYALRQISEFGRCPYGRYSDQVIDNYLGKSTQVSGRTIDSLTRRGLIEWCELTGRPHPTHPGAPFRLTTEGQQLIDHMTSQED